MCSQAAISLRNRLTASAAAAADGLLLGMGRIQEMKDEDASTQATSRTRADPARIDTRDLQTTRNARVRCRMSMAVFHESFIVGPPSIALAALETAARIRG